MMNAQFACRSTSSISVAVRVAAILLFGFIVLPAQAGDGGLLGGDLFDRAKAYVFGDTKEPIATAVEDEETPVAVKKCDGLSSKWPESCGTGKPPFEIDPRYVSKTLYEGHWDVVFKDSPELADAYVVINDGQSGLHTRDAEAGLFSSGMMRHNNTTVKGHGSVPTIGSDGSLHDTFGNWGACSCSPFRTEVRPSGNPDILVGHWTLSGEKGVTIWRRRPSMKIESVVVHRGVKNEAGDYVDDQVQYGERPVRIERDHKLTCGYGNMRGNCPTVTLSIRGQNFAGAHDLWLDPASYMEMIPRWECSDGRSWGEWNHCTMEPPFGHGNTGIRVQLIMWDGIKPGPRTLWVDGQPVPFELSINNFPDEIKKPELISLEAWGTGETKLEELPEGVPFTLEAAYDEDHPDEWVTIDIPVYASSKKQVVLYRMEDPKFFSSDWLTIEAGADRPWDYR
jgi:hypothetical protein